MKTRLLLFLSQTLLALPLFAEPNGKLQIHFIDVGQGDSALIVSPKGETILVDAALAGEAETIVEYLKDHDFNTLDYVIVSHYDRDHVCGFPKVLAAIPVTKRAFDRGTTKTEGTSYQKYAGSVPTTKRTTVQPGNTLTLDAATLNPVQIEFKAANGNGVPKTNNENDRSVVFTLRFGGFDALFGGDLSGMDTSSFRNIESAIVDDLRQVELYKVNHHGSQYSSNPEWLSVIKPKVAVISCGTDNVYHHPTPLALKNLHDCGAVTYWTESGAGATPEPVKDTVGGNIVVEVQPASNEFTVTCSGTKSTTYSDWVVATPAPNQSYVWSEKSPYYHLADCGRTAQIAKANRREGTQPPPGKTLHTGCPKY